MLEKLCTFLHKVTEVELHIYSIFWLTGQMKLVGHDRLRYGSINMSAIFSAFSIVSNNNSNPNTNSKQPSRHLT